MAETVVFSKILHVRENEKKDAQKIYYQAMDVFEKVASELYVLLKKKETAEEIPPGKTGYGVSAFWLVQPPDRHR